MSNLEEAEWEDVLIIPGHPDLTTQATIDLDEELKKRLVTCMINHRKVFAWSPQKVRGISPRIMEHRFNIFSDAKLIK